MPTILGLTGNIASGKTTVGLMLLELGAAAYVDADAVVHELYLPGKPLVGRLAQVFGPAIVDGEGGVDRRALGAIVFADREKLRQLESIVHPAVQEALLDHLRQLPADGVGVLDAIKLVESGYAPLCHAVWLVESAPQVQVRRLVETRGLTEAEARERLAAQPPLGPKRAAATEIIENDGTLENLRQRVTAAWEQFTTTL